VVSVRLVKLQGAWAGPEGEAALQQEVVQIKVGWCSHLSFHV